MIFSDWRRRLAGLDDPIGIRSKSCINRMVISIIGAARMVVSALQPTTTIFGSSRLTPYKGTHVTTSLPQSFPSYLSLYVFSA